MVKKSYAILVSMILLAEVLLTGCSDPDLADTGWGMEANLSSIPLEEALTSGKPTLAEFGSSTCVPCKQMKPILGELAVRYEGKLNVVIVEVYEQRELSRQHGIMSIPTQVFFAANGKEVFRHAGYFAKKDILYELKSMGIE